jgi:uncharacterized protein YjbI with pentapeptide repeats
MSSKKTYTNHLGAYDLNRLIEITQEDSAPLKDTHLEGLPLKKVKTLFMKDCRVSFSDANHAQWTGLQWSQVDFSESHFIELKIEKSRIDESEFLGCDFRNAQFKNILLTRSQFNSCELSYSVWEHCLFSQNFNFFNQCFVSHAEFIHCVFDGVSFLETSEEDFESIKFSSCTFLRCQLRVSQLSMLNDSNLVLNHSGMPQTPAQNPIPGAPVEIKQKTAPQESTPTEKKPQALATTLAQPEVPSRYGAIESFDKTDDPKKGNDS